MQGMDLSPLIISLKTACTATVITFFLGLFAARRMARYEGRMKSVLDSLFILPLLLPPTVLGFGLLLLFGKHGPIGRLLFHWGTTVIFSWWATVITATVVAFPLMYQTARGAFEQLEPNLEDAARTLGLAEGRIFWQVTVPLAWPGIAAGIVLSFARSLGEFGATLMLAGNIPGKTQTLPIAIYFAVEAGETGKALGWVLVILLISFASLLALNHWKKLHKARTAGAGAVPAGGLSHD